MSFKSSFLIHRFSNFIMSRSPQIKCIWEIYIQRFYSNACLLKLVAWGVWALAIGMEIRWQRVVAACLSDFYMYVCSRNRTKRAQPSFPCCCYNSRLVTKIKAPHAELYGYANPFVSQLISVCAALSCCAQLEYPNKVRLFTQSIVTYSGQLECNLLQQTYVQIQNHI